MSGKPIEALLTIEWATHLDVPAFVVEPDGTLLFYNEPAEVLLGRQFEDTGPMAQADWASAWVPCDADERPLLPEELPLVHALEHGVAAHAAVWITGLDGVRRHIDITAIPLLGREDRLLAAVALFWESEPP
jgi:hypothetical protein